MARMIVEVVPQVVSYVSPTSGVLPPSDNLTFLLSVTNSDGVPYENLTKVNFKARRR